MKLVKIDNYELKVSDELLLLTPFKKLYKRDRSKEKADFMNFLTMLYFWIDPRSDFSYIINEELRLKEVCDSNGFKVPKFSKEQQECIDLYKKMTITSSSELLQSTKIAINKVKSFLEEVDLQAVDDKGKPIYTVSHITAAIKMIPQLSKDIIEAEKIVQKEIEEQGRAKGNQGSKTLMDDGIIY